MNEIIVRPDEIKALVQDGEKFLFKAEAEKELLKLLKLQEMVDKAVEQVKSGIAEAGKTLNPNFKGVIGERVRCIYRAYGGKYKFDWKKKKVAQPFLKTKDWTTVDTDKVKAYIKEVGELPDGIYEADREEKLSIMVKDEED